MPIGPFQNTERALLIFCANADDDSGPMSTPIRSPIRPSRTVSWAAPSSGLSAATTSVGRRTSTPRSSAVCKTSRTSSTRSLSTRERPTSVPRAARSVKAMAPPTMMASTRSSRFAMTLSLSETFAPPSTPTKGCSGPCRRRSNFSTSSARRYPATAGRRSGTPTTDACARCDDPKASLTYAPPRAARAAANSGSFLSSPGSNLRFSSNTTGASESQAFCGSSPIVTPSDWTFLSNSSPSLAPTGARRSSSMTWPLGLPRWEQTARRAPRPRSASRVGMDARTRRSSVMAPPLRGTFRSHLTMTRLPSRSRSSRRGRLFSVMRSPRLWAWPSLELGRDQRGEVDKAARVTPLVVVPAEDFDQVAVGHRGQPVQDARVRVPDDVTRNYRVLGVFEDALHPRGLGRLTVSIVDVFGGHLGAKRRHEVGNGPVRHGHSQRDPVESPLELGHRQRCSLSCTGRCRDDVYRRGACSSEVLVREVQRLLVVRVRVTGRHGPLLDPPVVLEHLDHRNDAVCGARCIRDDVVRRGIVGVLVDPQDDRQVLFLRGGGDDYFPRAGVDVFAGIGAFGEEARRLDHDVDTQVAPRQIGRVFLREEADLRSVDGEASLADLYLCVEAA